MCACVPAFLPYLLIHRPETLLSLWWGGVGLVCSESRYVCFCAYLSMFDGMPMT